MIILVVNFINLKGFGGKSGPADPNFIKSGFQLGGLCAAGVKFTDVKPVSRRARHVRQENKL
jgi:hypothetical protein